MPPINKESFKDCLRRSYSGVSAKVFKDHCVKSAKYGVFSGPYFPAFGLNTERYGVSPYLSVFSPNAGKYGPEKIRIWTLFTQWMFAEESICTKSQCPDYVLQMYVKLAFLFIF